MRRRTILAAPLLALPGIAQAQAFPTRSLRIVVPFAPGGSSGNVARIMADAMAPLLGQPVVVDFRAGAGGSIGSDAVAKSAPDGYTLLQSGAGTFFRPLVERDTPYDPRRDFGHVGLIGEGPFAIVTRLGMPNTLAGLIAAAKAAPGRLTFASSGQGTTSHLANEMFNRAAGIEAVHVPYRGSGQATVDLIAGRVDFFFDALSTVLENARAGRIQLLAVTTLRRAPQAPDIPTVAEAALPGFSSAPWWGINCPAGVPAPIVARINAAMNEAMAQPAVKTAIEGQGINPSPMTPAQFEAHVWSENAKWSQAIEAAGLKVS
jgi:tripartite-type tricarboxylate transporter receptor subunit TctC